MKENVGIIIILATIFLWSLVSVNQVSATDSGEQLFQQHCSACHLNGGNIINPRKTLFKAHREENNVDTVENIIDRMRHPGPGMSTFTTNTISDDDAKTIAEYILKAF